MVYYFLAKSQMRGDYLGKSAAYSSSSNPNSMPLDDSTTGLFIILVFSINNLRALGPSTIVIWISGETLRQVVPLLFSSLSHPKTFSHSFSLDSVTPSFLKS